VKKNNDTTNTLLRLISIGLCLFAYQVEAKNTFPVCAVPQHFDTQQITNNPVQDALYLEADTGLINRTGVSSLVGNILIQQNDLTLSANNARLNGKNNSVTAKGNVVLSTDNLQLNSDSINYQLNSKSGELNNVRYQFKTSTTNGHSKKIIQTNSSQLELRASTYTTCPPSINSWHLFADNIKLDQKKQVGTAKFVTY
jgi:LPS-assembly protein